MDDDVQSPIDDALRACPPVEAGILKIYQFDLGQGLRQANSMVLFPGCRVPFLASESGSLLEYTNHRLYFVAKKKNPCKYQSRSPTLVGFPKFLLAIVR
jgi:hypothetical protein